MRYETKVLIGAPIEDIWAALVDVEHWPEWTGSMLDVRRLDTGEFGAGSEVRAKQPRLPAMTWHVTELQAPRSFTWATTSGGVTTTAEHRLAPADGGVEVTFALRQDGVLAPLVDLLTGAMTRRYVDMEARGLKRHCE